MHQNDPASKAQSVGLPVPVAEVKVDDEEGIRGEDEHDEGGVIMGVPHMREINAQHRGVLSNAAAKFSEWSIRWIPDAMVFVLVLTLVVYLMGLIFTDHGPLTLIDDWVKGFWALLTFAMQISLLMITASVVADSQIVKKFIKWLAQKPKTVGGTYLMFAVCTGLFWWFHWGLGMMMSIILGKEIVISKKGQGIHYLLLVAIAYIVIPIANGPSMAAQLLVATPGHFMEKAVGIIPLTQTTFNPGLLILQALLLVSIAVLIRMMMPRPGNAVEAPEEIIEAFEAESHARTEKVVIDKNHLTPSEKWDRSPIFMFIIGFAGLYWVIKTLATKGITGLDLNTLNFAFLSLGILLHRTPRTFLDSVQKATSSVYGVIIQFPFYAGIFGMISYSGLTEVLANWFVSISTKETFPLIVFLYTGFVNFFVPSGGSKFVIEAPYIISAAQKLGTDLPWVINAYTAGDLWTNLLQPFWALPILTAFRVKFGQILPYGFIVCLWVGLLTSVALLVLPPLF